MSFLMRFCAMVVNTLCLPLHLMEAVGLYQIYKRIFPICLGRVTKTYNKKMHDKKTELFRSLSEFKKPGAQLTLLEIGCGTGANFEFYPPGCKVICTDPNPHFQKYLKKCMDDNGHLNYERFVVASGEDMGSVEDDSVDAVVCTLVLCSVSSIAQTLREAHRILRPLGATHFPSREGSAKMSFLMRFCAMVVNALCLPLHLMEAVGLYQIYKRIFPMCLYRISINYNKKMHDKKTELFRSLSEFKKPGAQLTLLEIGCGTGANFEFYPPGCKVICTDPNPHFQKYLKKCMDDNGHLNYERFVVASGEDMGSVEDDSVDAVVCTLVLCSVSSIAQTLREAHRILRPGGAFFFIEHVVADPSTWAYFFQHVLQPIWYYFGDGCEVTRETWKHLEAAGFSELKMRHVEAPLIFVIKPHIVGYAVK